MNLIPLYIYVALTLYSRYHYRCQAARGHEAFSKAVDANPASCASENQSSNLQTVGRRLLLNLLPTAILILTPAVEYARQHAESSLATDLSWVIMALAGSAIHLLGTRSSGRAVFELAGAAPGSLVTTGEFALIRHPIALSLIFQGLGAGMLLGMKSGWLLWAAASLLMVLACWLEDRELARRYPCEWAAWSSKVKAFICITRPDDN